MTSEQMWVPELLAGTAIADVGDRFEGDVLGYEPVATWRLAVATAVAAFAQEGALERIVELSSGPRSAHEYLDEMVTEPSDDPQTRLLALFGRRG